MNLHLLLVIVLFSLDAVSWAQQVEWTGGGDGLSWNDADNWSGLVVPGATDDVIITSDTVQIANAAALASSIFINEGRLIINSSLTIANSDTFGISCLGGSIVNFGDLVIVENGVQYEFEHAVDMDSSLFINRGNFEVVQSAGRGIYLDEKSRFVNRGMSQIFNTLDRGIFASGVVDNYDTIIAGGTSFSPFMIQDTFINRVNAFISSSSLKKLGTHGIELFGGVLLNLGQIELFDIEATGLYNTGKLVNQGTILMDSIGQGLVNEDSVINSSGALINICTAGEEGIINGFSVFRKTHLENSGTITLANIAGTGIINRGCFTISVHGIIEGNNFEDEVFENEEGAILDVAGELIMNVIN